VAARDANDDENLVALRIHTDVHIGLLERMHKAKMRAAEQPHELTELDARIARLRKRMAAGDPDITPDELRAALDQIALGLDGVHPQIMLKARLAVRELLGQIRLEPGADGSLWAAYEV
jgi:hypothetical protein